jgi:hypothetical protein
MDAQPRPAPLPRASTVENANVPRRASAELGLQSRPPGTVQSQPRWGAKAFWCLSGLLLCDRPVLVQASAQFGFAPDPFFLSRAAMCTASPPMSGSVVRTRRCGCRRGSRCRASRCQHAGPRCSGWLVSGRTAGGEGWVSESVLSAYERADSGSCSAPNRRGEAGHPPQDPRCAPGDHLDGAIRAAHRGATAGGGR